MVLSTAAFCLWDISPSEKLNICRQLDFKRIQIALSTERMARDVIGHLDAFPHLGSFTKIAVHAPWRGVKYAANSRTKRILTSLSEISAKIPVECFIFRVDCISDIKPIIKSGLPVCIENSDAHGSWAKMRDIAEQNNLPIALNLNRATRGEGCIDALISEFGSRISRIQVSGYSEEHGRMPILSSNQLNMLDKVSGMDVPLVLEGLFAPGDMDSIGYERRAVWKQVKGRLQNECEWREITHRVL